MWGRTARGRSLQVTWNHVKATYEKPQPAYASSQALLTVPVEGSLCKWGLKASKPIWAATSILTFPGIKTSILSILGPAKHFLRGQGRTKRLAFLLPAKMNGELTIPTLRRVPGLTHRLPWCPSILCHCWNLCTCTCKMPLMGSLFSWLQWLFMH